MSSNRKKLPAEVRNEEKLVNILKDYTHKLESLRDTVDLSMLLSLAAYVQAVKNYRSFLAKNGTPIKSKDKTEKTYNISPNHQRAAMKLEHRVQRAGLALKLLPRTFVVSFVTEFDAFLSKIVKEVLYQKPEILNGLEKQIKYAELISFKSLKEAQESLIDKEIDGIFRESHTFQMEWLEKKLNLKITETFSNWSQFIELTERRNLYIHTDGVISKQYVTVCNANEAELSENTKLGAVLDPNPKYFDEIYLCLYELSVIVTYLVWSKLKKTNDPHDGLNHVIYDLLLDEKNLLISRISESVEKSKISTRASDETYRIFTLNRAHAYKCIGKSNEVQKILESLDWSATDPKFKLCVAALNDDFALANEIMKEIGKRGSVQKDQYDEWPILKDFRQTSLYSQTYKKLFGASRGKMATIKKDEPDEGGINLDSTLKQLEDILISFTENNEVNQKSSE